MPSALNIGLTYIREVQRPNFAHGGLPGILGHMGHSKVRLGSFFAWIPRCIHIHIYISGVTKDIYIYIYKYKIDRYSKSTIYTLYVYHQQDL